MTRWTLPAAAILLATVVWSLARALPTENLMDFGSFHASGWAAGEGLDPYAIYPLTFHLVLPGFESWNPNLNPPPALPLFQLFAAAEPHDGFRLWWAVSFVSYAAAVALLVRRYGGRHKPLAALWAFSLAGFWDTLVLGQIYLVLVLAAVGAWLLLERGRPVAAGLLIGVIVAVKPNFLVWPALLLLAGHTRPALTAAAMAAALNLAALAAYGPGVYVQWAALILREGERALFLTNASLTGLAQRIGAPGLGTLLSVALLGMLALRARRPLPPLQASALGLLGAVLASPIAWVHYTLFLLPVFFMAPRRPAVVVSAALLTVPVPMVLQQLDAAWWVQATLGSVYGWAVVLCLAGLWAGGALGRPHPLYPLR